MGEKRSVDGQEINLLWCTNVNQIIDFHWCIKNKMLFVKAAVAVAIHSYHAELMSNVRT